MSSKMSGESFVISGIAGRYPGSNNVTELKTNLFNGIDMLSDDNFRWSKTVWSELPKRAGFLSDLNRFDASFFGVHAQMSNAMDPQFRCLLELAYEAIFDAGIHPDSLRGSRTNTYIAQSLPETLAYNMCVGEVDKTTAVSGSSAAMIAGRLAYHLHLNGAAIALDTACSGSISALNLAFESLHMGKCDAALVGGCNVMLNPITSAFYVSNNMLSMDGYCRSMDQKANGFARSEAGVMIFLQRETNAKRIYAHIMHVDTSNDGFKQEGISFPSVEKQTDLLTRFYKHIDVNPHSVAYLEVHGTGTLIGDVVECASVDNVFCNDRAEPLLIGTIKSNMGHSECASGLCGITKAVLCLESGFIPPNLHYEEARRDIPSLVAGRLKVCTEITPLSGPLLAVNSLGFAGSNTHCLLRQWHQLKVNGGAPDDSLPRLVNWAGRTDESISSVFDKLAAMPMDAEFIGLLHETQETTSTGHLCRGFGIFESRGVTNDAICLAKEQNYFNEEKRPVVWIFSGMGSQWCRMGESLRQIDIARDAIDQCHQILQPYGIDLWSIITSNDPTIFDSILNAFVGICSIQIALVHILHAVGLPIDLLIGHSVGELVCSYADGSLTLSEAIMCAYWRGKVTIDETFIDGRMAAIGLSAANIKDQLPEGVYVACHNSSTSCTLSGPKDKVERFVAELESKGIFAKTVNTGGVAFHSKYIYGVKTKFSEKYKQTIAEPKLRSEKWLSTSVPMKDWHLPAAKFSSAEYQLNNLLNPVLFEEALQKVPINSIIVEIAPCGLLQAILKRELPNAIHIPMMHKFSENNSINILKALGRIFIHGIPLRIKELYPPIQFPVSRGTPMIAPLIKWDHSDEWVVSRYNTNEIQSERKVVFNLNENDSAYMKGHIVDDRCLLPAMGYLHLVRESLLIMTPGASMDTMNVHFEDLKWLRATRLAPNTSIHLTINIHRDSGRFEITEKDTAIASGIVKSVRTPEPVTQLDDSLFSPAPTLKSNDFYKELRLRGYMYEGDFRGVRNARADGRFGTIEWKNDNWVTFMDAMLQVSILSKDSRSLQLPTGIREIKINTADHLNYLKALRNGDDGNSILCGVRMSPELNTIVCGGIEITGLTTDTISRRHQNGIKVLDRYEFVPLHGDDLVHPIDDAVRICTQLVDEILLTKQFQVVEVLDRCASIESQQPIIEHFQRALLKMPTINGNMVLMTERSFPDTDGIVVQSCTQLPSSGDSTIIVALHCMTDAAFVAEATKNLIKNGFLISIEPMTTKWTNLSAPNGFQLLSLVRSESFSLVLMQREPTPAETTLKNVTIHLQSGDSEYKWLKSLQDALASPTMSSITLVAQGDPTTSGALGFVNCLRREKVGRKIQLVQIEDSDAYAYDEQLSLGLPINICRNGRWGTYRHMNILPNVIQLNKLREQQSVQLNIQNVGDLSSMIWTPASSTLDDIIIHYAALNFRDVMLASGRLSIDSLAPDRRERENFLGFELVGVTASGDRVMGICRGGAITTRINRNRVAYMWKVPERLSLREAATIPAVYATVYLAFFVKNEVKAGQSILIHAGTGGIGLAAIRVAFAYGLRVFTTVSSPEKRKFLLQEFTGLKDNHIGNSRDCSFEKMIMDETNGEGVDFVLNSLSEKKLIASVRCLRHNGVFLEIGKFDIYNNSNLGMRLFEKGITLRTIFADRLPEMPSEMKTIQHLMEVDLARGIIQPLPSTVFAAAEAEKAFRYLSAAKHIGKVLLQIHESDGDSLTSSLEIRPKVVCNPESVYVLVGGLGGFGLELADWLVIRGAQNIVLNSRCGAKNAYQLYRIGVWKSYGCKVFISSLDTTRRAGCKALLEKACEYGPVAGIFNLAVVLSDHAIENQTPKSFDECLAPKALSTKHLDEMSRQLCPKLEHFVVFSSAACGLGNAGQTNYGMANAIMERIIERRARDKLPAKAFQWGAIGDVGIVAEMFAGNNTVLVVGTLPQRIDNCLTVMDELMCGNAAVVLSMIVPQKQQAKKLDLVGTVLSIIGITDIKSVSIHATLTELGVDSLMNNEIKQMLERDYEIHVKTEEIRLLTVARLTEMTHEKDEQPIGRAAAEPKLNIDGPPEMRKRPIAHRSAAQLVFSGAFTYNLGNESTKDLNIIKANAAAQIADDSEPCVLVIPGIEGIASDALIKFCQRLKKPTFILQLHTTHRMHGMKDVLAHLEADILDLHKSRKRFCIVGYSFGSMLATEVARLLEREPGRRGHVYMIDANAIALHSSLDAAYGCYRNRTDERLRMKIITEFIRNISKGQSLHDEANLAKAESFDEKLDVGIALLKSTKYSKEYLRECIVGSFNRCAIIEDFHWDEANEPIDSDITLIQATETFIVHTHDSDVYIVALTNGKTEQFTVEANHVTILERDATIQMIG